MKKSFFILIAIFISSVGLAQTESTWGVKAGLNYNSNGDLRTTAEEFSADGRTGYHFGVFGKLDLPIIYLRPELVYTSTKSKYDNYNGASFDMQKLDLPVLVGIDIVGPLSVFAGPSFQYIIDEDFSDARVEEIKNDISVGFNIGAAVSLGRIGIDLRYERGFSDNEAKLIHDEFDTGSLTLDTRPSQVILSLSLGF